VSGTRGNMEGMRGTVQVGTGGAVPNTHVACFSCLAGREGEGRHVGMSGIPSGWERLEGGGRLATEHEKLDGFHVLSVPNMRNMPHAVCFSCLAGGRGKGKCWRIWQGAGYPQNMKNANTFMFSVFGRWEKAGEGVGGYGGPGQDTNQTQRIAAKIEKCAIHFSCSAAGHGVVGGFPRRGRVCWRKRVKIRNNEKI